MILELVEKKYSRINNLALVEIDHDDATRQSKIHVSAPVHHHIDGVYKIWKYGDHGYVWAKTTPSSSIRMIIFFNNSPTDQDHQSPIRNRADRYIYIYELNPVRTTSAMQQVARCEINLQKDTERWYVQDNDTLLWNHTTSVSYAMTTNS